MLQTANDVWNWLSSHTPAKIRPGLERMEHVLEELGHPERRLKVIHIAGTNGKGSVAAMLSSVLQEAGYSVGLFTSPELTHWSDRIQLNGEGIPEQELIRWTERLRPIVEKMDEPPTEFEYWTLIALCYFAYEATPWFTIMETGLGGRLDSTNVVYPLVSIITEIDRDHMEFLGSTIEEIALEKAGIIKSGVPVVTSTKGEEGLTVLEKVANERHSKFYAFGKDFDVQAISHDEKGQSFHFTSKMLEEKFCIQLKGKHQLANAGAAIMAISILCSQYATIVETSHLEKGLAKATWPGRMEEVSRHPIVLLDGAHNASGVRALADTLRNHYTYEKLFVVFAMMKEKESEMIQPLLPLAYHIVTTEVSNQKRSRTAKNLMDIILAQNPNQSVEAIASAEQALQTVQAQAGPDDMIVVAGSLYLIAQIRPLFM
ncbi:bifunctional folylpolyglutamate synthase/dihydrofolate synthase [Shimazuella sp. AN120528]|uniref:bifunctional folylpolyglutamate synthase/dihydrofolate synthase n=1 Tax=Shimazuella soli TaxID=1892854 RepID=UPI001F0ED334|nr:folylpolyglutamate synthase/dihydrofolate synthase family protein [Shimazuella soli]MCH5584040.1 bifunctional folylpolyglutamate synthase/dihydrofolate synthase [Shimazuella soli]